MQQDALNEDVVCRRATPASLSVVAVVILAVATVFAQVVFGAAAGFEEVVLAAADVLAVDRLAVAVGLLRARHRVAADRWRKWLL
jgi:hypothetical protein